MYQPYDWDNDRGRARNELMREDVKRWTLWDIGEILDKAVAKELLKDGNTFDPLLDKDIYNKDFKPSEFMWAKKFFEEFPKVPSVYLEDLVDQD